MSACGLWGSAAPKSSVWCAAGMYISGALHAHAWLWICPRGLPRCLRTGRAVFNSPSSGPPPCTLLFNAHTPAACMVRACSAVRRAASSSSFFPLFPRCGRFGHTACVRPPRSTAGVFLPAVPGFASPFVFLSVAPCATFLHRRALRHTSATSRPATSPEFRSLACCCTNSVRHRI